MNGGSTANTDAAQGYHLVQSVTPDGRHRIDVSGTTIAVVGKDSQMVIEEVNRQLQHFLYVGSVRPLT